MTILDPITNSGAELDNQVNDWEVCWSKSKGKWYIFSQKTSKKKWVDKCNLQPVQAKSRGLLEPGHKNDKLEAEKKRELEAQKEEELEAQKKEEQDEKDRIAKLEAEMIMQQQQQQQHQPVDAADEEIVSSEEVPDSPVESQKTPSSDPENKDEELPPICEAVTIPEFGQGGTPSKRAKTQGADGEQH